MRRMKVSKGLFHSKNRIYNWNKGDLIRSGASCWILNSRLFCIPESSCDSSATQWRSPRRKLIAFCSVEAFYWHRSKRGSSRAEKSRAQKALGSVRSRSSSIRYARQTLPGLNSRRVCIRTLQKLRSFKKNGTKERLKEEWHLKIDMKCA